VKRQSYSFIKGQAIVELAIILPLLLLMIMGAFDFARAFYTKTTLTNAAREGAYYISYHPDASVADITTAIRNEAQVAKINITDSDWVSDPAWSGHFEKGTPVTVIITKQINLNIFRFFSGPFEIKVEETMLVQQ